MITGRGSSPGSLPVMSDMKSTIEDLWSRRDEIDATDPEVVAAVKEAIDLLDKIK